VAELDRMKYFDILTSLPTLRTKETLEFGKNRERGAAMAPVTGHLLRSIDPDSAVCAK
jgi:hypothetical protein